MYVIYEFDCVWGSTFTCTLYVQKKGTIPMGSGQNWHQLRSFAVVIYTHKITIVSGGHTKIKLCFFCPSSLPATMYSDPVLSQCQI